MESVADLIEIVEMPHGDAPDWVRRAWVGCVFPNIANTCGHVPILSTGVLDQANWRGIAGYIVEQAAALQVLAVLSPEAAAWFEGNGYPTPDGAFVFKHEHTKTLTTRPAAGKLDVWDDLERPHGP